MPAPAVIPALIAYINAVAVKAFVVDLHLFSATLVALNGYPRRLSGLSRFTKHGTGV